MCESSSQSKKWFCTSVIVANCDLRIASKETKQGQTKNYHAVTVICHNKIFLPICPSISQLWFLDSLEISDAHVYKATFCNKANSSRHWRVNRSLLIFCRSPVNRKYVLAETFRVRMPHGTGCGILVTFKLTKNCFDQINKNNERKENEMKKNVSPKEKMTMENGKWCKSAPRLSEFTQRWLFCRS